ncbi:uncharacterized protein EDB93DRAFT_759169 [Suillus bovinus]|uniref:uncharacterized protein n=1 Tax=Suillus bovinus TaxID=48563 RepID=UPI001B877382|nr:uncharacterized protein EDB93DRAFT_759169 [Suillus bovinus]KAG2137587.1 hypothetical protein EDB93DRAFT_759169 [Suillus bovinus]
MLTGHHNDNDLDELANEDDLDDDYLSDSDALLMATLEYQSLAASITGDGSRGRPYNQIPRCKDFFACCSQSPDREFRHYFRVGRDTSDRLVAKLADNPIFTSTGTKPQRHVKYQLGCFLFRHPGDRRTLMG